MENLNLENTVFVQNSDNTYALISRLNKDKFLRMNHVAVDFKISADKNSSFEIINGNGTERTCTMCGKRFNEWDEQLDFSIYRNIGYGSVYDGDSVDIDLCCDCFDKLIGIIAPMSKKNPIVQDEEI